MKITNTQPGPRGVNAISGSVLIDAGQTAEVEVYAREKAHLEASGWFTVAGDYTPDPGAAIGPPMNNIGDDAELKAEVIAKDGEIADLKQQVKARDGEIADLKNQLPETDIDKMTVPELRAHLAFKDVPFDSKKDKKDDLVTLAKASA